MSTIRKKWTQQQTEFLIDNYDHFSLESIARDLRMDIKRVKTKVYSLGLIKSSVTCYSAEDVRILIDNYKTKGNIELGKMIDRSFDSVKTKLQDLGLKRTPEQVRQIHQRGKGVETRFKKDNIPINHKPVNTISIRVDSRVSRATKWIKVAEPNKWDLLSRVNYRKAHPDEIINTEDYVSFSDRDPLNCEPDNLVIISRRKMMIRNGPKKNSTGTEMRSYTRLNGKKKKENKKEQTILIKKARRILEARKKRAAQEEINNNLKAKLVPPDLSSLIPVNIGRLTTIYIRPGQDPEVAKLNFLNKYKESVL